jgi:hypothetical protein
MPDQPQRGRPLAAGARVQQLALLQRREPAQAEVARVDQRQRQQIGVGKADRLGVVEAGDAVAAFERQVRLP